MRSVLRVVMTGARAIPIRVRSTRVRDIRLIRLQITGQNDGHLAHGNCHLAGISISSCISNEMKRAISQRDT
jgi:hypothetical protein